MTTYLTKEHLYDIQSVTNPVLSPNNEEAVFIRTIMDKEDNKYFAHLFHVTLQDKEITQWTFGKELVSSPKWSPDGKKIAFLSNREEKNQLFVMSKNGGEAKKVADFPLGVTSFVWGPCSKKLWVAASLKDDKSFTDKIEKEEKKLPEAYVVDKLKYKMDGVGGDGLRKQGISTHIVHVSLDGEITQFTEGNHAYSLNGISNDGKTLIIGVNRTENQDFEFRQPLYLVDIETKKETVLVDQDGYYGGAVYSFDDRYIAYVGSDASYKNSTHSKVYVYDTETTETVELTAGIDAPVGDYVVADVQQGVQAPAVVWTESNALYFQLSTMGDVRLYYASLDGAIYPASPEGEHVYGYDIFNSGNEALVTVSNLTSVGELFHLDITTGERTQLTHFNDAFLAEVTLSTPEPIVYKGAKDWDVHGWIMKPANYKDGEKYPLIVEVHGGPHTMYANSFFHEMQLLAAQGYGVLFVNPRGSHGYSQAFVDAVRGDYGGGDYEDIMAGLDYALENYNWIDEQRLGITGGSYGGFMTNWVVGHTNRFKAAVTQRSISNWISFFGVSDIGYYFSEWQIGTDMMDVETLWKHSPLKYAKNVETPLLILHSEKDFRCPIEQAEQLYVTLKTMGKEVGFVRFPDCDHNLSRTGTPNLRLQRLDQIVSWFKKYI